MEEWISYIEKNAKSWDKRTQIHLDSSFYDVAGFKQGRNVLNSIELDALGDVKDKKLLHLQCHFGMDTLCWARLGAQVTGVDLSGEAIANARNLSMELNIPAKFLCTNLYSLPGKLNETFDIVFTSYGTIIWLPDVTEWARIIAQYLKPGGTFYFVDFHPFVWMLDDNNEKIHYPYFNKGVIHTEQMGSYTGTGTDTSFSDYTWNHSMGELISALIKNGLRITKVQEYDYSPYNCLPNMIESEPGKWQIKGKEGVLPMLLEVIAVKD